MNVFLWNARARNGHVEATLNHPFPAQARGICDARRRDDAAAPPDSTADDDPPPPAPRLKGPPPPPMPTTPVPRAAADADDADADDADAADAAPKRPPGWKPPPPKRGEARKQEVVDALVALSASTDMAQLEAAVDAALQCGVGFRAGKGCDVGQLQRLLSRSFSRVSADFWTSDHLSERPRSVNLFSWNARARNANVEATLNHPCPAQVGFDSDEMVRARTRLQFLAATDDARSLLLKALEAEPTTKELGDAIAFAVSSRRPASSARLAKEATNPARPSVGPASTPTSPPCSRPRPPSAASSRTATRPSRRGASAGGRGPLAPLRGASQSSNGASLLHKLLLLPLGKGR